MAKLTNKLNISDLHFQHTSNNVVDHFRPSDLISTEHTTNISSIRDHTMPVTDLSLSSADMVSSCILSFAVFKLACDFS